MLDGRPGSTGASGSDELELLRLALDVVQENIYILDREIRYVYVNQLGAAVMGLAPAQMM